MGVIRTEIPIEEGIDRHHVHDHDHDHVLRIALVCSLPQVLAPDVDSVTVSPDDCMSLALADLEDPISSVRVIERPVRSRRSRPKRQAIMWSREVRVTDYRENPPDSCHDSLRRGAAVVANDSLITAADGMVTSRRVGEMLAGRYRLKSLLGSGGMGDVFAAESLVLHREVALKVLREEHAKDKRAVARFLREARAAAKVSHPHVVHILDAGIDENGIPFIAQELLSGEDLGTYLDRHGGRLGVDHALEIMRPVIDAMAIAHSLGVVHRDLKPENIFLARDDEGRAVPKVLDFGISKIVDEASIEDRTQTGVIVGTPHYMAPEQIIGSRELDGRVDVWALGVILFELMTGEIPFGSRDDPRIFMRIAIAEARALDAVVPSASKDLARIVQRCLRRNIGERYPSAAELARDLKNLKDHVPIEATQKLALPAADRTPIAIVPMDRATLHREAQATVESSVAEALARLDVDPDAPPSDRPTPAPAAVAPKTPVPPTAAAPTAAAPDRGETQTTAIVSPIEPARPGLVTAALAFLLAALVVAAAAMRTRGVGHEERTVEAAPR